MCSQLCRGKRSKQPVGCLRGDADAQLVMFLIHPAGYQLLPLGTQLCMIHLQRREHLQGRKLGIELHESTSWLQYTFCLATNL